MLNSLLQMYGEARWDSWMGTGWEFLASLVSLIALGQGIPKMQKLPAGTQNPHRHGRNKIWAPLSSKRVERSDNMQVCELCMPRRHKTEGGIIACTPQVGEGQPLSAVGAAHLGWGADPRPAWARRLGAAGGLGRVARVAFLRAQCSLTHIRQTRQTHRKLLKHIDE